MRNELRSVRAKLSHREQSTPDGSTGVEQLIGEMQDLMWADVGIVRDGSGLRRAIAHLEKLTPRLANPQSRCGYEALNIHTASLLVARSALAREESRGAHYRTDFPALNDAKFLKHSVIKGNTIRFV
jgi:L-aspartate oxidase